MFPPILTDLVINLGWNYFHSFSFFDLKKDNIILTDPIELGIDLGLQRYIISFKIPDKPWLLKKSKSVKGN